MEKEKSPSSFDASTLSKEDCIEILQGLKGRTRCYTHFFREMGEEYCNTLALIDKEALERAIQALLASDK